MFTEAQQFCFGASQSINTQRAKNLEFQKRLDMMIRDWSMDQQLQSLSYHQLIEIILIYTKENVQNDGDNLSDKNSVGWHLGILCYIARNSCNILKGKFDVIFIDSWKRLFPFTADSTL